MAWWVLQNVAVTAALAAVAAIVCRLTRIGPVARHALWLVVLVKLVTPPLVVWPWAVPDVFGIAASHSITAEPSSVMQTAAAGVPRLVAGAPGAVRRDVDRPFDDDAAGRAPAIWPWLFAVWAFGSAVVLLVETTRAARLARRVRTGGAAPRAIVARANELASVIGVRPPRVVAVDGLASPAVWAVGRPVLMWPADSGIETSAACLDGLLVHELAHLKRRDHLVGWLELAAGIVWWWNPLFWFVRASLREQAELSCDAWVIAALPQGRRAYAESLLAISGAAAPRIPSPSLVVGIHATSRRVLERRLVMIMKGRAPVRLSLGTLVALAVVAGATLPAWAVSDGQQTPPPPAQTTTPPPVVVSAAPPPATTTPAVVTPRGAYRQITPVQTTPPPAAKPRDIVVDKTVQGRYVWKGLPDLPADGKEMVEAYEKERAAIMDEATKKAEARRDAVTKSLQALQEQYTKAGKLDEAIAIRDYLRAGGPGTFTKWIVR